MLLTASSTSTILCLSYTATAANGGNQMMRNFLIFLVLHVANSNTMRHIRTLLCPELKTLSNSLVTVCPLFLSNNVAPDMASASFGTSGLYIG